MIFCGCQNFLSPVRCVLARTRHCHHHSRCPHLSPSVLSVQQDLATSQQVTHVIRRLRGIYGRVSSRLKLPSRLALYSAVLYGYRSHKTDIRLARSFPRGVRPPRVSFGHSERAKGEGKGFVRLCWSRRPCGLPVNYYCGASERGCQEHVVRHDIW